MPREWPFPGDSLVARARKTALAYRQVGQDVEAERQILVDLIRSIDPRVIAWIDNTNFQQLYKQIQDREYPKVQPVAELDQRLIDWGQSWHAPDADDTGAAHHDDDMINSTEAAKILTVAPQTITRMRTRGVLTGTWHKDAANAGGRWHFRAGDVYALLSERRSRGSRVEDTTDTLNDSGRSDLE